MKWWTYFRRWLIRTSGVVEDVILTAMQGQRERDAQIAESFAKKGKGAQGVQCALALRIATAIRSPTVAPDTPVICAWPEAVEHEGTRALLTPDATYTVERIVQHKAPATVWLRELPGIKFPSTAFREAE